MTQEKEDIVTLKRKQIEKIGVVFEKAGMSSVAARIIALLMVAEPPHKTVEEIVEEVNVSKSSVNNTIKLLQSEGMITYITFPGDRKRYFALDPQSWLELLKHKVKVMTPIREILQETVSLRSDQYPEFNQYLLDMCDLYYEFEKGVLNIIEEWEKKKKRSN